MASQPCFELVGPITRRWDDFDEDKAHDILERLADGQSLTAICNSEGMPSRTIVYAWLKNNRDFANDYARARSIQADTFAEMMQDVANDKSILPENKRIMVDVLKWRAARQNWRSWGDKVQHEHTHEVHAPVTAAEVPAGIAWIRGKLLGGGEGPEPGDSGVGEE